MKAALLAAADVPQGWTVYTTSTATGTQKVTSSVTSDDPRCAAFVALVQDPPDPRPPNQAEVEFDGGNLRPPFIVESVEAYATPADAAAALASQRRAVADCSTVRYSIDGRVSPVTVRTIDPPALPVPAVGLETSASTGELTGYRARIIAMQVGDTIVSMTFLQTEDGLLADLAHAAATKAQKVLGTTAATTT